MGHHQPAALGINRSYTRTHVSLDRQQYFAHPVSVKDVPDYLDIVKHPMSWDEIDERLETHAYNDLADFQVRLVPFCELQY